MDWQHAQSHYEMRSFRACPSNEEYEGYDSFVFGPVDFGPTHHHDIIAIRHDSGEVDLRVNFLHHPEEGGVILDFFRSSNNRQVVDLTKTTHILVGEDGDLRAGVITPLGDGTFRVDLDPGFSIDMYGPLRWKDYLEIGYHKKTD